MYVIRERTADGNKVPADTFSRRVREENIQMLNDKAGSPAGKDREDLCVN